MVGHQNETKRHFELRNLDNDMKAASAKAGRVVPRETFRRMKAANWMLLAVLIILVGLLVLALGGV